MKKLNKFLKTIIIIAVLAAILGAALLIDSFSTRPSGHLSVADAQEIVDAAMKKLPLSVSQVSKNVLSMSSVEVKDVKIGNEKNFILNCSFSTPDASGVYFANKEMLFADAYGVMKTGEAEGKKISATHIMVAMAGDMAGLLADAKTITGEVDITVYDTAGGMSVYLDDTTVNTLLGGLIDINKDVDSTYSIIYGGEEIDIKNNGTLRSGITQCFGLSNYSSDIPDVSTPLRRTWNSFKKDFYNNFIKDNRWQYLLSGLGNTLLLTLLSLLIGTALGFITAIIRCTSAKTGKLKLPNALCQLYITVIRGTPVMVQLLIIYFVLLLPIGVDKFVAAVLCFGINSGAYVSEIIRGGIMSVDGGQDEAGRSLGFGFAQTMWYIIMPQAFKAVLPALCNEFIALLKETSVAFYIGVSDLTQGGMKIRSLTFSNFMPLLAVALIYLAVVMILTKLVGILERNLRKNER